MAGAVALGSTGAAITAVAVPEACVGTAAARSGAIVGIPVPGEASSP